MDDAVTTWAWAQLARPMAKLVLVALASEAGRAGECEVPLSHLCELTGLAKSSVAEALGELERLGRLSRERGSGGRVTRYRLLLPEPSRSEPGPETVRDADPDCPAHGPSTPETVRQTDTDCPGAVPSCPGDGQRVVREADSGCPGAGQSNPPLKPPLEIQTPPLPPQPDLEGTHRGGGEIFDLVFPSGLSEPERHSAAHIVAPCNGQAQAVLDELAALMAAGSIRVSPLSCLRGLARRVAAGTFVPEAGLKVREQREREQRRSLDDERDRSEWPDYLPRLSAEETARLRADMRRKAGRS